MTSYQFQIEWSNLSMATWDIQPKPAELAENRLVEAILDGTFPINSNLPPERELAESLGVTRPTLREALQRLSRDGWIEIHHGRATRVKDYWCEGNLLILTAIAQHQDKVPSDFVTNLLQIRLLLAPAYTRMAMQNSLNEVIHLLESLQNIEDTAEEFTRRDLDLHKQLTIFSKNPIFTLILNGFGDPYNKMGNLYFSNPESRAHSRSFYKKLLSAVLSNDFYKVEEVTRQVMQDSIQLMQKAIISIGVSKGA
ncbi:MAG: fatty acid metabolism transcriptional regulator FadR [Chloroflexi bacterium HGW-Chloroflexi-5]|jgi:GntR family negative regulator for fad regulon and positive regulator of fabA|nr:MAG: fatty acid metabolism transcriptional regulator FadR [Chloroflexi bacterium HGW-Chloroflexi-5]